MSNSIHSNRQSINRKIAVMGYPHVGKSALVLRFTQNIFPERYESTIEDQHSKHVSFFQRDYNLRVTDTAGQQEYTVFPRSCSFDINGFVLVYSIEDRKSFEMCSNIHRKIVRTYGDSSIPILIVGNKTDLHVQRVVDSSEGAQLASGWGAKFMEISARDSNRVSDVFELLLREIEISRGNLPPPPVNRRNGLNKGESDGADDGKSCSIS